MTDINEAREAVYQRFASQWGTTTYTFEGEHFEADKQKEAWVRLSVRQLGGGQETLGPPGARKFRRRAQALLQTFVPSESASIKDGDALAKAGRAIFEGQSFSELDFDDGEIQELGDDGRWFTHLMRAFFAYTETK